MTLVLSLSFSCKVKVNVYVFYEKVKQNKNCYFERNEKFNIEKTEN